MTHRYACLDENNIVTHVTGAPSEPIIVDGVEIAIEIYYASLFNCRIVKDDEDMIGGVHLTGGTPFRKNAANRDFTYDEHRDAFIPPQPFPSWTLNEETCLWDAPTPMPTDENIYWWDENTLAWITG